MAAALLYMLSPNATALPSFYASGSSFILLLCFSLVATQDTVGDRLEPCL